MEIKYLAIPLIGCLIGWLTNFIAIKMIFRPYKRIRIPLTPYFIQGIIPKRRYELSRTIGQLVEDQLLSVKDIVPVFESELQSIDFSKQLSSVISHDLYQRMPRYIPTKVRDKIGDLLGELIYKEVRKMLPKLTHRGLKSIEENIAIGDMVEEKINGLELAEFEDLLVQISRRELKHIEYLGAFLGLLIGLGQMLIVTFFY